MSEAKEITPRAKAQEKTRIIVNGDTDGSFPKSSCAGRSASKTRVNALMTRASIFFAKRFLRRWMDCRVKPGNDARGVVPARGTPRRSRRGDLVAGTMVTAGGYGSRLSTRFRGRRPGRRWLWTGRSTNLRLCEMTAGAISLFRVVIYNDFCNSHVSGRRGPNLLPKMCHPICRPDVAPSVVI